MNNDPKPITLSYEKYARVLNEMDRLGSELHDLRAECGRLGAGLDVANIFATADRLIAIGGLNYRKVDH